MFISQRRPSAVTVTRHPDRMDIASSSRHLMERATMVLAIRLLFFGFIFWLIIDDIAAREFLHKKGIYPRLSDFYGLIAGNAFLSLMAKMFIFLALAALAAFLYQLYLALDRRRISITSGGVALHTVFGSEDTREISFAEVTEIFLREDIWACESFYSAGVRKTDDTCERLVSVKARKHSFGFDPEGVPPVLRDIAAHLAAISGKPLREVNTPWHRAVLQYLTGWIPFMHRLWN